MAAGSIGQRVSEISGRGVGLGAVIDSCTQLGGMMSVKSEVGRGSRFEFKFVLPSLVPAPLKPLAATRPAVAAKRSDAG
jgi:signal transduction histidine kinase